LDKFFKKCVREGIVPGKYFKMPNTVEEWWPRITRWEIHPLS
jgi:hypothetical protein